MKVRHLLFILSFAAVALLGYWLAGTAAPPSAKRVESGNDSSGPRRTVIVDEAMPKFRRGERPPAGGRDTDAMIAGALEGQRVVAFADQDALNAFLARAGDGISVLGRLDALNALRLGFSDYGDLRSQLDGDEEESFIFPVSAPAPPEEGAAQAGAMALGDGLLDWLGITGDNSSWGEGVRIAVLDTGVAAHSAFDGSISAINLVDLPYDPATQNGHGTAVASVIIGNDPLTPGVAPGSEILSVRIADDNGQSDSFLLAEGIIAGVDGGADVINISMGSFGDSRIVRNAIDYANARGILIIAASGNNGTEQVSYPAANDGVVAVGAVDALGNHLDFSNSGETIALSAPGYELNAAWPGDQAASVSGTSFSSPIIAGAVAAIMTESGAGDLTAGQAYQLLVSYLNDGGAAGKDNQFGGGMPDIGRVLNRTTPGIYDAAVAGQRMLPANSSTPFGQLEVLVQNRGTETLINTVVNVSAGGRDVTANITSLAPNAVTTVRVPITRPPSQNSNSLRVDTKVTISNGRNDVKPSNDRRVETYVGSAGN